MSLIIQRNKIQEFLTESDGNQRGVGFNRVKGRFAKSGPFLLDQDFRISRMKDKTSFIGKFRLYTAVIFFLEEEIRNSPRKVNMPLISTISIPIL